MRQQGLLLLALTIHRPCRLAYQEICANGELNPV